MWSRAHFLALAVFLALICPGKASGSPTAGLKAACVAAALPGNPDFVPQYAACGALSEEKACLAETGFTRAVDGTRAASCTWRQVTEGGVIDQHWLYSMESGILAANLAYGPSSGGAFCTLAVTASLPQPDGQMAHAVGQYSAEVGMSFSSDELRASGACTVGGRSGRTSCDAHLADPGGAAPWASFMATSVMFHADKERNGAEMAVKLRSTFAPCPGNAAEARRRHRRLSRRLASNIDLLYAKAPSYAYSSASGVLLGGNTTAVRGVYDTWATSKAGFVFEVLRGAALGPTARFSVALEAPAPRLLPSGYFRDEDQIVAFVIEERLFWWYIDTDCEGNLENCPAPDHLSVASCVSAYACAGEATGLDFESKDYLFVVSKFVMFPSVAEEVMPVRWTVETAGAVGAGNHVAVSQAPALSDMRYRLTSHVAQKWLSRD